MDIEPIQAISEAIDSATSADNIGMLTVKTANVTLTDASRRPNPEPLYHELWYEGEVCCLFSDSNLGKSIYAVQMAEEIAVIQKVLLVDCELSDKQFQLRYTDTDTNILHQFPEGLYRAEINPMALDVKDYEEKILQHIEEAMLRLGCKVAIIDNLTYLCNSSDKGVDAGIFMMKLMNLKKRYGWSLLIIAHTPKRVLSSPITQNDLAGSKKLYNFFDSVFAIGKSAKDERLRYVKQLKVLQGRKVIAFPDIDAHEEWTRKLSNLPDLQITVSPILQQHASEQDRQDHIDIADWLIRYLVNPPDPNIKQHSRAYLLAAKYISPECQDEVEALINDLALDFLGAEKAG